MADVERRMIVRRKLYNPVAGDSAFFHPDLLYSYVLRVEYLGKTYNVIRDDNDVAIGDSQVRHSQGAGGLFFNESFPFVVNEKLQVIYKR